MSLHTPSSSHPLFTVWDPPLTLLLQWEPGGTMPGRKCRTLVLWAHTRYCRSGWRSWALNVSN